MRERGDMAGSQGAKTNVGLGHRAEEWQALLGRASGGMAADGSHTGRGGAT